LARAGAPPGAFGPFDGGNPVRASLAPRRPACERIAGTPVGGVAISRARSAVARLRPRIVSALPHWVLCKPHGAGFSGMATPDTAWLLALRLACLAIAV
jgi:hypothetical protein